MSACVEAASPAVPRSPSTDARAARLAKFERERVIVEYLNRGVSVPEIAAHVGVSDKRMRAIIREILARRMPAPPEEFVAMQVSRLSEALLVAYSAMSGMNLKAVDRVVKIVRELDRYHGFAAAERRFPVPSPGIAVRGLEAPAQNALAFGAALFCRAEFAPQDSEGIESAPGLDSAPSPLCGRRRRASARWKWSLPSLRSGRASQNLSPSRAASQRMAWSPRRTIAGKTRRKPLKTLNPRPGSDCRRSHQTTSARYRSLSPPAEPLRRRKDRSGATRPCTIARTPKLAPASLHTTNDRHILSSPRMRGSRASALTRFRRAAVSSTIWMPACAGMTALAVTIARETRRKALKILNPRPGSVCRRTRSRTLAPVASHHQR
jgi:hypothetical protein